MVNRLLGHSEIERHSEFLRNAATINATKSRVLQTLTGCRYENLVAADCLDAANAAVWVNIEFHLHGSHDVCNSGHLRVLRWPEIHPLQLRLRRERALRCQQDCSPEKSHASRTVLMAAVCIKKALIVKVFRGASGFPGSRFAHPVR